MRNCTILLALFAALVLAMFGGTAHAALVGQLGILDEAWFDANPVNPGTAEPWKNGDTYHLAFVTSTSFTTPDSNIATYNGFVQGVANNATNNLGSVTWKAIVSTSNVNANVNAAVTGPVYNMIGALVASSYGDLWDGTISNPINYNENQNLVSSGQPWTGTNSGGTKANPIGAQADGFQWKRYGNVGAVNSAWIDTGSNAQQHWGNRPLYALSEPVTVQATTGIEVGATAGNWQQVFWSFQEPETLVVEKDAKDLGPFDMEITVTGGINPINIQEAVRNSTGEAWADYHFQLGTGLGQDFLLADPNGELYFTAGSSDVFSALGMIGTPNPTELAFSGGSLAAGNMVNFGLGVHLPDGGPYSFTLRQWPTLPSTVIPEPSTMCALGLAFAGLGGYVRRRRMA